MFPSNVPGKKLLKYAVEYFNHEPVIQEKLKPKKKETRKIEQKREKSQKSPPRKEMSLPKREKSPPRKEMSLLKREKSPPKKEKSPPKRERSPQKKAKSPPKKEKSPSRSRSREAENKDKKFAKYENLRPLSNCLLKSLASKNVAHFKTKKIVGEIVERIITAGYNWDKILYYQSKSEDQFNKKLIPYFFMSKDELPSDLSPDILLKHLFEFIESSKLNVSSMILAETKPREVKPKTSLLRHPSPQPKPAPALVPVQDITKKRKERKHSSRKHSTSSESEDSEEDEKPKKKKRRQKSRSELSSSDRSEVTKTPPPTKIIKQEKVSEPSSSEEGSDSSSNEFDKILKSDNKVVQKQSLLEKVNAIIKSCVKLKDEKKISGSKLEKANKIIAKAEAKKQKLLKDSHDDKENINDKDSIKNSDDNNITIEDNNNDKVDEKADADCVQINDQEKIAEDIEEGEITDDDEDDEVKQTEKVSEDEKDQESIKKEKKKKKKMKSSHKRRRSYSSDSNQGNVNDELQAMAGGDNRRTRKSLDNPARSRSRTRSLSQEHSYRRKAAMTGGARYTGVQYRSRSPSDYSDQEDENSELHRWIPITPCTIMEEVEVEPMSTAIVTIRAKGEFSFKDNPGCYVRYRFQYFSHTLNQLDSKCK